jgi:hypothetical protein
MKTSLSAELAAAAARLVVEEGMEYGPAKRKAARVLGRGAVRTADLPGNDAIEDEVLAYLQLFHADTQPGELAALRRLALRWMERLADFRPHLTGAVWRGTATRHNDVHLQLFCDDCKSAEIALINQRVDYAASTAPGPRGDGVPVLSVADYSDELAAPVTLHLAVLDHDDLRGALRPGAGGRTQRGDAAALRRLLEAPA